MKKCLLSTKMVLVCLSFLFSFQLFSQEVNKTKIYNYNIQQDLFEQALNLFKAHGITVREADNLEDSFSPLDCSGFAARQAAQIVLPHTWGKQPFSAKDGEIMFIYKSGTYKLVEGGPGIVYQPLKNTVLLLTFTREGLKAKPKKHGKHTLIIVQKGSIGIAYKVDGFVILKPGFHWLKDGETNLEQFDLGIWLNSVKTCDQIATKNGKEAQKISSKEPKFRMSKSTIGQTGYVIQKVIMLDPNIYMLRADHNGIWHLLEPGLSVFPPQSAPNGKIVQIQKHSDFTSDVVSVADSGYKISAHFRISLPNKEQFTKLNGLDNYDSFEAYLLANQQKSEELSKVVKRRLNLTLTAFSADFENGSSSFEQNIDSLKAAIEKEINKIHEQQQHSSYLSVEFMDLGLDDDDIADHLYDMGTLKRKHELNDLKRSEKAKDDEYNCAYQKKSDETKLDKQHQREIEKLTIEQPAKLMQAEAKKQKAKAKKKKAKLEQMLKQKQ